MSGDYTRFSHDPLKRYAGVLMQQGRVQLDADWNEEIDILRRRLRTTALDTFGPVGVPYAVSPGAFAIGLPPGLPADLSIGAGRLYVDGVQVEAFVSENATYLDQPFMPPPLPGALPVGDVAVYLDIWDREVTYIEDPELLDAALGGADTTTRVQTVWQLHIAQVRQAACGLDVGEPPSAGRLTTRAIAPPASDDPCILPPASGYRGLENRLYRIEVHTPGALGTATFKWSRDNGSIVSAVRTLAVSGTQTVLEVNRIGRDQFMRFLIGDWVTVTDDHRELMGEPGEMAQVADIDETNRRIVIDRAIPTGGGRAFGATGAEITARRTRIQKWDQTAAANPGLGPASGLIATAAGPIAIEAGIEIQFSAVSAGGSFRVGDYWVFWARTATAQIEELTDAPPRGIAHRYLQLAAITGLGGPAPVVSDCRPPPPQRPGRGESCCTIVVDVGEDIQAGIDALPPQGGCVCLKAGVHVVRQPLRITRGGISLHAESPGTTVRSSGAGPVLIIGAPTGARITGVDVAGIAFEANAPRQAAEGIVTVTGCADVRIDRCAMRGIESRAFIGVAVTASDRVAVTGCAISAVIVGIWVRVRCEDFVADGNSIELGGRGDNAQLALAGILVQQSAFPCRLTRNLVGGALLGIVVNDNSFAQPASLADRSIIADNLVDLPDLRGNIDTTIRLAGIDCAADGCTITGNKLRYRQFIYDGIRINGALCVVTGNVLLASGEAQDPRGPIAIRIGTTAAAAISTVVAIASPLLGGIVSGNLVSGSQHGVLITNADDFAVADNVIEIAGPVTWLAIFGTRVGTSRIEGNSVRGALSGVFLADGRQNRIAGNAVRNGAAGISVLRDWGPAIDGNRIDNLTLWGVFASLVSGRCEITANRINACGRNMSPIARAIALNAIAGEAHIAGNEVMDTGSVTGAAPTTAADHGISGDLVLEARVSDNLVTYSNGFGRDPLREDRALVMRGLLDFVITDNLTLGFGIQIHGNKFIGAGRAALVELPEAPLNNGFIRFERVTFANNYCLHISPPPNDNFATVSLTGRSAIVTGNHLKARFRGYFSFDFNGIPGPCIGNVVAGPTLQHPDFPTPFNAFNIIQF